MWANNCQLWMIFCYVYVSFVHTKELIKMTKITGSELIREE